MRVTAVQKKSEAGRGIAAIVSGGYAHAWRGHIKSTRNAAPRLQSASVVLRRCWNQAGPRARVGRIGTNLGLNLPDAPTARFRDELKPREREHTVPTDSAAHRWEAIRSGVTQYAGHDHALLALVPGRRPRALVRVRSAGLAGGHESGIVLADHRPYTGHGNERLGVGSRNLQQEHHRSQRRPSCLPANRSSDCSGAQSDRLVLVGATLLLLAATQPSRGRLRPRLWPA